MKKILLTALFLVGSLFADQFVKGHYKKDGSYVDGHFRSSPNSTKSDNFSTYGNVNPYNGKEGTKKYDNYNNYGNSNSNKGSGNLNLGR